MSAVYVAIPITKLSTRLIIRKGQPWSVIEHLVLDAIAQLLLTELGLMRTLRSSPGMVHSRHDTGPADLADSCAKPRHSHRPGRRGGPSRIG
jgi:hypothetical protein